MDLRQVLASLVVAVLTALATSYFTRRFARNALLQEQSNAEGLKLYEQAHSSAHLMGLAVHRQSDAIDGPSSELLAEGQAAYWTVDREVSPHLRIFEVCGYNANSVISAQEMVTALNQFRQGILSPNGKALVRYQEDSYSKLHAAWAQARKNYLLALRSDNGVEALPDRR